MTAHKQNSTISYVIKKLRADYGLSQMALANELGVETSTVQRWESGTSQPKGNRAFKLQEYLRSKGIELDEVVERSAPRQTEQPRELPKGNVLIELIKIGVDLNQIPADAVNFITIRDAQLFTEVARLAHENELLRAEIEGLMRDKNNLRKFIGHDQSQVPSNLLDERKKLGSRKRRARGKVSE